MQSFRRKDTNARYIKIFERNSWESFKQAAEYYFSKLANPNKGKAGISSKAQATLPNVQQRLYLGLGCELLLKACYVNKGYNIVKPEGSSGFVLAKQNHVEDALIADTVPFGFLIDNFPTICTLTAWEKIEAALRIFMAFRAVSNTTAERPAYTIAAYAAIEHSIIELYNTVFNEHLEFRICMNREDTGIFKISSGTDNT